MKKKISVLLSLIMIVGVLMGGCGSKMETAIGTETEANEIEKESVETVMEETASIEVVTEETQEAAETTEDTLQTEEETTSVETQEAIDTSAEDMNKILRLIEAYNELIINGGDLEYNLQLDAEYLTFSTQELAKTADGNNIASSFVGYATIMNYYNQYVNDNGTYYDISDWIMEQPSSEYIKETYAKGGCDETNKAVMLEAAGVVSYLTTLEKISLGEMKETNEYVMASGEVSAYAYPLICNGEDVGLTAVYDENGRLLNICSLDTFDLYVGTDTKFE